MRLLRYGPRGAEKPGCWTPRAGSAISRGEIDDITRRLWRPTAWRGSPRSKPESLPLVEGRPRIGPPVASVPNLVCIGLNYADHARETNSPIPEVPIVFMKHTGSIIGPNDQVKIPRGSTKTDWEVELGVVIGSAASYVDEARRDGPRRRLLHRQRRLRARPSSATAAAASGSRARATATFAPIGPVAGDQGRGSRPAEPRACGSRSTATRRQDGSTRTMIFGVTHLVAISAAT